MVTIKIDGERWSEICKECDVIGEENMRYDRFLFDDYCLEIEIKEWIGEESQVSAFNHYHVKLGLKDADVKAFYEGTFSDAKIKLTATVYMDKEGNIGIKNLNDNYKKILKLEKEHEGMPSRDFWALKHLTDIDLAQSYIMYKLNHREVIIKETSKIHKPRLTKKAIEQSTKNEGKDIILDLDRAISYIKSKGLHKIHCECWGVRGHYRHYKSGKVTFVAAYQKGKKRNEKKINKTYVV